MMRSANELPVQAQWAAYFQQTGLKTIPIYGVDTGGKCLCKKLDCSSVGKHPMTSNWQTGGYFGSYEDIVSFWRSNPLANYGILTEGLIVVDIDGPKGMDSYAQRISKSIGNVKTLKVSTGRGRHEYFRSHDLTKNRIGLAQGIDIKTSGGYVLGPGSMHATLKRYEVLDSGSVDGRSIEIAEVPQELLNILNARSVASSERKAHIALGGPINDGSRNDSLTSYVGGLVNKQLPDKKILELAMEFNDRRLTPSLEQAEVRNVVKSVSRYKEESEDSPLPLYREIPPSSPFPLSVLGNILTPAARVLADSIQAPEAMVGQSLIAAASLAVQGHANIRIHNRVYPTSLFFVTVGESGERKSAIDKELLSAHRAYEREQINLNKLEIATYLSEKEIYEAARRRILNSRKTSMEKRQEISSLGPEPQIPYSQILLVEEPTYEGLIKLLEKGRPSVGLFSDEGGRMVGGHGMNNENLLKTIAGFSSLWDGGAISRIRSIDGALKMYGKRISLHLMMQPKVAQGLLCNAMVNDQGFLSRCLIAFPESMVGRRIYRNIDLSSNSEMNKYRSTISALLNRPLRLSANSNELVLREIDLDVRAEANWINFHNDIERELGPNGRFQNIRGFASKAAEQALRLAGVLCLFDNVESEKVLPEHISAAIELVNFYLSEAIRLQNLSVLNPDLVLARKLLDWCQSFEEIHLVQIYQYGPGAVREKATAKKILAILEEHKYLIKIPNGKVIEGRRRNDVWWVKR